MLGRPGFRVTASFASVINSIQRSGPKCRHSNVENRLKARTIRATQETSVSIGQASDGH